MTTSEVHHSNSPEETLALGRAIGGELAIGDCVALTGSLGAGKTLLVRGVAEGFGAETDLVSSPTYVLVQEYPAGRRSLFHLDLYRMADPDAELADLGLEEMLADGAVLVEWAERAEAALPQRRWDIRIDILDRESRRFHVSRPGSLPTPPR